MRTVFIGTHLAARFLLKCETFRIIEIPQLATQTKLRFNSTIYLTAALNLREERTSVIQKNAVEELKTTVSADVAAPGGDKPDCQI